MLKYIGLHLNNFFVKRCTIWTRIKRLSVWIGKGIVSQDFFIIFPQSYFTKSLWFIGEIMFQPRFRKLKMLFSVWVQKTNNRTSFATVSLVDIESMKVVTTVPYFTARQSTNVNIRHSATISYPPTISYGEHFSYTLSIPRA